jgi:hypothetical protein
MNNKFNKFNSLYEKALKSLIKEEKAIDSKQYTNGLKIGTTFRLKPSFFSSSESVKHLNDSQISALKEINDREYDRCKHYFKIKTENRKNSGPNVKSANDSNSLDVEFGVISAAEKDNEIYKFILPLKDIKYIEICDWKGNLPPILSPKNEYSFHNYEKGIPQKVIDTDFKGLGNSPTNRSLPTQNTKL